ncbi:tRNA-(ms[2]io[6]A)-hydroxylase [Marinospirillum perlucidum]|uniref:tRNA-(ms[2]io[6]A)-hydroxylase n=1 Tax=Marinospirillum perlucidum TaxID=1982602 RepID=UPI000DF3336D|nr:tRNA-(ms[2]io[6]A)-hydroxylase [Marinospirillum perlucidum]
MTIQEAAIQPPEIPEIDAFLLCSTPQAWVDKALDNLDILLIDHAQCEKKAAATAMSLMHKHLDRPELLKKMSQLAREELLHFEQVVNILQERGIDYKNLSPARYAEGLRQAMRTDEQGRFIDLLIIGAIIEARSCERFVALIPYLDPALAKYYRSLVKSEARHFEDYLALAELYDGQKPSRQTLEERKKALLQAEQKLIEDPDPQFRFHSGPPAI